MDPSQDVIVTPLPPRARVRPQAPGAEQTPSAFVDHYRCGGDVGVFGPSGELSPDAGFFTVGDLLCYGPYDKRGRPGPEGVVDVSGQVEYHDGQVRLPFDLSVVAANLQRERYQQVSHGYVERLSGANATRSLYYFLRPMLPVPARKQLQRLSLSGWDRISFPRWPVDFTVESLMEYAMTLALKSSGLKQVPFIWFWPDGAPSCAIMTHDVEGRSGRDFCDQLMDLDDAYGVKAAFQVVPEHRYQVSAAFLENLRTRGFEVNVHDLNHDGQLFRSRRQFLERVAQINRYGREFHSRGFRAGVMYRQQEWFDALDFSYDMSVPNVAHLEPQRGGCCTTMPYFVGNILELPLTTIQDYSLFHILGTHSIALWQQQIDLIRARHGLISFIAHPDYLIEPAAREAYGKLLAHLRDLRTEGQVWMALPGDVDRWWRNRHQMTLVQTGQSWRIEGPDCHRARVAFATLESDRLVYRFQDHPGGGR